MLSTQHDVYWSMLRKIIFRFFFIYFFFTIAPWNWLNPVPGVSFLLDYYYGFTYWLTTWANNNFFHIQSNEVHGPVGGSGDTSLHWAELALILIVAAVGCVIWSIVDRKRKNYIKLNYWLCLFVRYNIAIIAFGYGIIKLFGLQMTFPMLSQLATPLGDLLPMRLSWMFIGYSTPYQFLSGLMEVLVGLLLLFRRTATMGVLMGTAVFLNVMILNFCYDIPVKLYSSQILVMCFFLLYNEADRIACFFILNRPAASCTIYSYTYPKRWMKITRIILKMFIIVTVIAMGFYSNYDRYKQMKNQAEPNPFKSGVYDVVHYAVNSDTLPPLITDTIRWQDFILEKGYFGSVKTSDTLFRERYNRGYFNIVVDTATSTMSFKKFASDSIPFL